MRPLLASLLCLLVTLSCHARQLRVATPAAALAASRELAAGDILALAPGDYRDLELELRNSGTAEAPITLRAENPGTVRLTGNSSLRLRGNHLILRDLLFTEGALSKGAIIDVLGDHCRLTEIAIVRYNPASPTTRYHWVRLHGVGHRVDHCRFEGMNHSGVTLQVVVDKGDNRHRIDHNHFLDRPRGSGNGFESLQLGQSPDSLNPSRSIVEFNLFEACDGEVEVVSNKSCENTYRHNALVRCAGALCLRHGDRCVVEGNWISGGDKKGSAGIRVIGRDHEVRRNLIENINPRDLAALALYAGMPGSPLNGYWAADRAFVHHNLLQGIRGTALNTAEGADTRDRTQRPVDLRIENNLFLDALP